MLCGQVLYPCCQTPGNGEWSFKNLFKLIVAQHMGLAVFSPHSSYRDSWAERLTPARIRKPKKAFNSIRDRGVKVFSFSGWSAFNCVPGCRLSEQFTGILDGFNSAFSCYPNINLDDILRTSPMDYWAIQIPYFAISSNHFLWSWVILVLVNIILCLQGIGMFLEVIM